MTWPPSQIHGGDQVSWAEKDGVQYCTSGVDAVLAVTIFGAIHGNRMVSGRKAPVWGGGGTRGGGGRGIDYIVCWHRVQGQTSSGLALQRQAQAQT